jgi:hypothetical protein
MGGRFAAGIKPAMVSILPIRSEGLQDIPVSDKSSTIPPITQIRSISTRAIYNLLSKMHHKMVVKPWFLHMVKQQLLLSGLKISTPP